MDSREVMLRTLDFGSPDRVARSFEPTDMAWIGNRVRTHATEWRKVDEEKWERLDEWGNLWSRIDESSKGEVERGVLHNLSDINDYEFPDYSRAEDFDRREDHAERLSGKFVIGGVPGFTFNIARKMRRLEDYLMELLLEPDLMRILHDKIDIMLLDMIGNYASAGADAVMFCEDWGTQSQTLVNPDLWRQEFFPRTRKLCACAHEAKMKVLMHSCGKIGAIVPGLIEAGIDLLQFDQPRLHGIDTLAAWQKDANITFWCPVDIQKTLQSKDESLIRAEAREMIDKLWRPRGGGFVAGYYGDNASIGLDPRWQAAACDEFVKQGVR
ncbi:MAG: hypothetical protein JW808_07160 [Victivallales bacterium]|nr:hypothetical protein [Victivallales bacterium]